MPLPRIHIAPTTYPISTDIAKVVSESGGEVVNLEDANAIIWLANHDADLRDYLSPKIEWVQLRAAGVDKWVRSGEIDAERIFTGARGAYTGQVAEHAVALLYAAAKELRHYISVKTWRLEGPNEPRRLAGATLVLVGAGSIGQEIMRLVEPLGLNIIAVTRSGRPIPGASRSIASTELANVLPEADFVLLTAPGVDSNRNLIGRRELDLLQSHTWLINVGRGTLVDTEALTEALAAGKIGGAALDVVDPEPLPEGHPLWNEPRCLITPHRSNPPSENRRTLLRHIAENVSRFANERPLLGVIDLQAGY